MRCIMFVMPVASDTQSHVPPFGGGGEAMENVDDRVGKKKKKASTDRGVKNAIWLVGTAANTNLFVRGGVAWTSPAAPRLPSSVSGERKERIRAREALRASATLTFGDGDNLLLESRPFKARHTVCIECRRTERRRGLCWRARCLH